MGRSIALLTFMEAMQQNVMPSASDIKSGKETVESVKAKLQAIPHSLCKREQCCNSKPATTTA